ncbi:hypothetical protein [Mycobacterium sp.]|uniref:hypothetical protein n=1 Tax=Mycobacterium sp. TaxID=1785 RepID=UPI002B5F4CCC|nr:hypothetical protein [Mycobacterium sp.]HTQ17551.1 hypothetical protein [Mycobacterium sp.]
MSQPPEYPGYPGNQRPGDQAPGGYQPAPPGYGQPPQSSGYGAPPPPPPPPPGYGAPPAGYGAPAPPPGYGQPPAGYTPSAGGGIQFSAGDAFNWAWNKFTKNAAALIVPMLIYGAAMAVIIGIAYFVLFTVLIGSAGTTTTTTYGQESSDGGGALAGLGFFGFLIGGALVGFFIFLAAFYIQGAFVSGCLQIADGQPVSISSFLQPPRNLGSVLLAALLVAVGTSVGYALCFLPGIIFLFFSMFTIPYVIDRGLAPVDALKASFDTVNKNLGSALLAYLVTVAVGMVGNAVCVGGLISIPVSMLIMTYTYRRLSGGQIAPMTP